MRTNYHFTITFMKLLRSKIIVGNKDECWLWTGAIVSNSKPYGQVKVEGKNRLVHRVIYELYTGEELLDNVQVCHSCDNPRCCNPNHLWVGTNADNMLDKMIKGRTSNSGPPGKFNYNEWQEIKRLFYIKKMSKCEIARKFNTYDTTIRRVLEAGDHYKYKE